MWPYRPWLFKAQQPFHGQNNQGHEDSSQQDMSLHLSQQQQQQQQQRQLEAQTRPPTTQFLSPASSQTQVYTHPLPQAQPRSSIQPRLRPHQPTRNWLRRYQPSVNARVYGYPSSGGVLILPGYTIDLPYLGLEQATEAKRASDSLEEDNFCRRLRWLGAIWWQYPDADLEAMKGHGSREDIARAGVHVCVGWLANGGGIWVLKYDENNPDHGELGLKAQRLGSLNMNDRCRMIEDLGGRFYKHPDECPDLRWNNWPAQR